MAQPQGHISLSVVLSLTYAAIGILVLDFPPEHIVLASVIIIVAGMLPNVDQGSGNAAREFGTVLAAVSPLVLLQMIPSLGQGGVARVALLVTVCYVFTRLIIVKALQKYAVHRGMFHSIPAAIITFELTYLLFWDVPIRNRLYISTAAFIGFLSHLLLDASGNIDLVGRATGKAQPKTPVLKLLGATWKSTLTVYSCVAVLGWFIAQDFYPNLGIYAGLKY